MQVDLRRIGHLGEVAQWVFSIVDRLGDILSLQPRPDAVLISAGLEDCLQAIRGIAPAMQE